MRQRRLKAAAGVMAGDSTPVATPGDPAPVYLVCIRHEHHAAHSGYEGVARWLGARLWSPLQYRRIRKMAGYRQRRGAGGHRHPGAPPFATRLRMAVLAMLGHPGWLVRAALVEGPAALHMLVHTRSVYHVLYGDLDLQLLGALDRLRGHAVIATFHHPPATLTSRPAVLAAARGLSAVVLVSRTQRTCFEGIVAADRIFVVPHGVDTEFFTPSERLATEPVCITVGSHRRDFPTLAEAMRLVWQAEPRVRWAVVGSRQARRAQVLPEDPRVDRLDWLSDEALRAAYRRARVAVLPLTEATANNALLEAMACGLPIVSTDVGGIREYLDEQSGFACPPGDPVALAVQVLRVLRDPQAAAAMATAARRRVLRFDYRVVAEELRQVYREVLSGRAPPRRPVAE